MPSEEARWGDPARGTDETGEHTKRSEVTNECFTLGGRYECCEQNLTDKAVRDISIDAVLWEATELSTPG